MDLKWNYGIAMCYSSLMKAFDDFEVALEQGENLELLNVVKQMKGLLLNIVGPIEISYPENIRNEGF